MLICLISIPAPAGACQSGAPQPWDCGLLSFLTLVLNKAMLTQAMGLHLLWGITVVWEGSPSVQLSF